MVRCQQIKMGVVGDSAAFSKVDVTVREICGEKLRDVFVESFSFQDIFFGN